jgi:hypothetical protein
MLNPLVHEEKEEDYYTQIVYIYYICIGIRGYCIVVVGASQRGCLHERRMNTVEDGSIYLLASLEIRSKPRPTPPAHSALLINAPFLNFNLHSIEEISRARHILSIPPPSQPSLKG